MGLDEAVMKYYRQLIKGGFKNAGSYEKPSIFLDTVGVRGRLCVGSRGYMRVYINVEDGMISGIKYMCSCDPTANVTVEILCDLLTGRTLDEAAALTTDMFLQRLDGPSEELRKRAEVLIEVLNNGIKLYHDGVASGGRRSQTL
jgi:NifU-like protein involved in Fe-S cluster formation